MEQLTEMDYSMLQMENERSPAHIGVVMMYDQSSVKGGVVRFKAILQAFEHKLHTSTVFRRKLAGSTGGFDTPYWVEDPDFTLKSHLRHIALPKPGDWRQFCILLARLHSRGVDMKRPPWEAYVIEGLNTVEGLPAKSFAVMLKVHHAAVDGVAIAQMVNDIHNLTSDPTPPPAHDRWQGEPDPSPLQVWPRAFGNALRRPGRLVKTLRELAPKIIQSRRDAPEGRKLSDGFSTRFNRRISAQRVMDALILDLDEVKGIRQAVADVTVNDVIVSVVGGGLRKYLQAKDDLPAETLITSSPISVREEQDRDAAGNQVGMMRIALGTDLEDPIERLRAVRDSAQESKQNASAMGTRTILDLSRGLSPSVIGGLYKATALVAGFENMPLPQHTIVSNVPGPRVPLYLAGARLHAMLGLAPLSDGMGLSNTVMSAAGKISITAVACPELMPDPQFYRECLRQAWDELLATSRQ